MFQVVAEVIRVVSISHIRELSGCNHNTVHQALSQTVLIKRGYRTNHILFSPGLLSYIFTSFAVIDISLPEVFHATAVITSPLTNEIVSSALL